MSDDETASPSTSAQGEARESDAELASELLMIARAIGGRPVYGSFRTVESVCERAAQRLSAKAEISETMMERAVRACCSTESVRECHFPNCICAHGAEKAMRVALEATLSGKDE